jgi:DNA ligase-associated metallophosphoesterase
MSQEDTEAILMRGARFEPDLSGALFWRAAGTLIVADLHFEKASSFARHGRHLPPYDTVTTLARLEALLERLRPSRVICLGDSFHDIEAGDRMSGGDTARLQSLCASTDWIWVNGNHDPAIPTHFGGRSVESLETEGVTFRHAMDKNEPAVEISGHFHPKATIPARGRHLTRPCFVYDERRIVLPAFGAFTGGLNVGDSAFFPRFPEGFHVAVLGQRKLHWFSSREITI